MAGYNLRMNLNSIARAGLVALVTALAAAGSATAQSGRNRRPAPKPEPVAQPSAPVEPAAPARSAPVPYVGTFKVKYAGGSLGFKDGASVTLEFHDGKFDLKSDGVVMTVDGTSVTDVSYGQSVRKRTAEAVGASVIIPGLGGLIGNSRSTAHYVEVIWGGQPIGGLAMRVDKSDYLRLIDALEATTGLKVRIEAAPPIKDIP